MLTAVCSQFFVYAGREIINFCTSSFFQSQNHTYHYQLHLTWVKYSPASLFCSFWYYKNENEEGLARNRYGNCWYRFQRRLCGYDAWNAAGLKCSPKSTHAYYLHASERNLTRLSVQCLILCYNTTQAASVIIEELQAFFVPTIRETCPDVPILLVGLKSDLKDDTRIVRYFLKQKKKKTKQKKQKKKKTTKKHQNWRCLS